MSLLDHRACRISNEMVSGAQESCDRTDDEVIKAQLLLQRMSQSYAGRPCADDDYMLLVHCTVVELEMRSGLKQTHGSFDTDYNSPKIRLVARSRSA